MKNTFGWISVDRNKRNDSWGFKECNFFSNSLSHWGAKWTFFKRTQLPCLAAVLIVCSASEKPSAEPRKQFYGFSKT